MSRMTYRRFTDERDMIYEDLSDLWQERYEEVSCNLYTRKKFDDTNDVSTTYLGYYKSKEEERTFPIDGTGVTEAFLMDNTPMNYSLTQGHQEVICQRNTMMQIDLCINYPNLELHVQG